MITSGASVIRRPRRRRATAAAQVGPELAVGKERNPLACSTAPGTCALLACLRLLAFQSPQAALRLRH